MLRIPSQIAVQLVDRSGTPIRAENVLVAVNLLRAGRYYYGNVIGLTDSHGRAELQGSILEQRYASDRHNFPSDYKLELIECDPEAEFVLLSEQDIQAAIDGLEPFGSSGDFRRMYERAQNGNFSPATVRCQLDDDSTDREVRVIVPAIPVDHT